MKATRYLLLSLAHETLATAGDLRHDDHAQLTLNHHSRSWLTTQSESESDGHRAAQDGLASVFDPLEALQDALEVMQSRWYELWLGTWPSAIDWTAAVIDTHLVSSLSTLSKALKSEDDIGRYRDVENDLNRYFSQNTAYYFGEDAFAIRNQAYDDMLWVVLGWLESVKFIRSHSERHYCPIPTHHQNQKNSRPSPWQGAQFISAFAHRARIFYDLSSSGWGEKLCGGGMVWSPYLAPYKNAITNELFITASIGMYLHFPGDNNTSPFSTSDSESSDEAPSHDRTYLQNAIRGYDWLKNSHMRNHLGLYTDGFHISHWRHGGQKCDVRNEMVFTYNQGVLLSGLRGLWEGTGNKTYLLDAHELVRDVIAATGWDLDRQALRRNHDAGKWAGIGRNGILEERCDASGRCSQDAQTFKGIFFHHLTLLCEALPLEARVPGVTFAAGRELAALHRQSCKSYGTWAARNARAAVGTRDERGAFGGWWGAGFDGAEDGEEEAEVPLVEGADDYRNDAEVLTQPLWTLEEDRGISRGLGDPGRFRAPTAPPSSTAHDPNDRGRGRTVETQSGGIAVLRCLWELMHLD